MATRWRLNSRVFSTMPRREAGLDEAVGKIARYLEGA